MALVAEPDDRWSFVEWKGDIPHEKTHDNPLTVTIATDMDVTALFMAQYTLVVTTVGDGTVDPSEGTYVEGSVVSLTATPDEGHRFDHWEGDFTGSENPLTFVMDADATVTAVFWGGVVPGVSIGPVALGDTWGDVVACLGAPSDLQPSPLTWDVFFVFDRSGIHGVLRDTDRDEQADPFELVDGAWGWEPFSGTYQGVGVSSWEHEVVAVMGNPEEIDEEADGAEYWYWSQGIMWDLSGAVVDHMYVFWPQGSRAASARLTPSSQQEVSGFKQMHRQRADQARALQGSWPSQ